MKRIAEALNRVSAVLTARPGAGVHSDAPALARWRDGLSIETSHPSGSAMTTDMPRELGGTGEQVSPGWMVRAGLAACTATTIAMAAARQGVALTRLDVSVESRSDTRGLLGMEEADGGAVYPGPLDLVLQVRIAARGMSAERLRALVETAQARAPMAAALRDAQAMRLDIAVDDE